MEKCSKDKYGRFLLNSTPFVYYDVLEKYPDPNGNGMVTQVIGRFFSEEKAKEYLKILEDSNYFYYGNGKVVKRVVKEYFYIDVDERKKRLEMQKEDGEG